MSHINTTVQENAKKSKSRALCQDQCHCCSDFRALVCTISDTSKSANFFAFNDEKTKLALTSRRWDVATLGLRDVGTSRRWDVATLGRRDVGTSRRWDVATLPLVDF